MRSLRARPVLRERLEGQTDYAGLSALRDTCAMMLSTLPQRFWRRLLGPNGFCARNLVNSYDSERDLDPLRAEGLG
jgi:hypothetical protein